MPFLASEGCFWPATASMTSEVKNKYAYVITKDISNKFIDVNFCVAVMLMSLMNKISSLLFKGTSDFEQLF